MWTAARCLLLALNFFLLSSRSYPLATLLVTLLNMALLMVWDRGVPDECDVQAQRRNRGPASAVLPATIAVVSAFVLLIACRAWLREILIYPNDAQRADMLIVIQLGIKRLLQGGNPYTMYNVPWPAPLPYGIVMWAPMLAPYLMHADLRFATILGALFIPVACAVASFMDARHGRYVLSVAWLVVMVALAFNPELRQFVSIGHTPAYWPLLALFAWLVGRDRWYSAALAGGLLIVARTTMVAIAPVLLFAVWHRARPRLPGALSLLAAGAVVPFLPFAIWDWPALRYALYGSYQSTMKGFVWTSTTWVQNTIGITGLLLTRGWRGAIEPVQIILLLGVYAAAWLAIRGGRRPLPWLAFALLVFSMTTLWPVFYLYFDVFLLLVCGALAEEALFRRTRLAWIWAGTLAASLAVLTSSAWAIVATDVSIDVGTGPDRPFLYAGFSNDERGTDRTYAWIEGTRATILVPRRSRSAAVVEVVVEPNLPTRDSVQQMSVALNGTVLGTETLKEGWQQVPFEAPSRAWQIGVNELTLALSSAVSPSEAGLGADTRRLSAAVDRLTVRTR